MPFSLRLSPAMIVATVGLFAIFCQASSAGAQQTEPKKDRPPRPSQDAVVSADSVVKRDVAYGDKELQKLDIYAPAGAKNAPIVLFVHGGEWTRHDKSEVSFKPKFFNEHKIVFASTNYRLSPAATHPAHASDVAAAIGWLHKHAGEFGGDPRKIFLMGHSAGCHLVTLVSLDPRYLAEVGLRPADLAGVVAWSGGAYDLVDKVAQGGAYADYIKSAFGDSPDVWRQASPVAHVSGAKAGPRFLFISIEPGNASHQAAERLAKLIEENGGRATSKLIEGRDHFGANHFLGAPDDTTGQIFLQFIRDAAD
ncbi:MAG TPA: alpha/beta hydrolase [Pirellulales bacterium]|nr:alpha/beta hydrolase [Pirellulales bacterium]